MVSLKCQTQCLGLSYSQSQWEASLFSHHSFGSMTWFLLKLSGKRNIFLWKLYFFSEVVYAPQEHRISKHSSFLKTHFQSYLLTSSFNSMQFSWSSFIYSARGISLPSRNSLSSFCVFLVVLKIMSLWLLCHIDWSRDGYVTLCCAVCLVAQSCLTLCGPIYCIASQAPLSMEFSRQEYWSGSSCLL